VAANVPGLRDSVRDGISGYFYEHGNIDQLTERLLLLLQDRELRKRIEIGGMEWAERFNWDRAAKEFEAVAIEVAEGKR
jgi:glycosyltransferase involved in cell wall biosynthesis